MNRKTMNSSFLGNLSYAEAVITMKSGINRNLLSLYSAANGFAMQSTTMDVHWKCAMNIYESVNKDSRTIDEDRNKFSFFFLFRKYGSSNTMKACTQAFGFDQIMILI